MAASVWIMPSRRRRSSVSMVRPSELTTPVVSVPSNRNGLPIASTFCPTMRVSELPSGSEGSLRPVSMRISARSLRGSFARIFAL